MAGLPKTFEFAQTEQFKNLMAKLYGWGASVVILGALFKILHWPGADIMLIIGLGTESIIFFFSAFEPTKEEYDWSLVYPQLAYMKDPDQPNTPTQELDNMLENANVDQALITRLGDNLRSFNDTVEGLTIFVEYLI